MGEKRDTGDCEGNILDSKPVQIECLDKAKIQNIFQSLIGKQQQIPPIYSAIKINGKKLYEYARKGEKVEIQPREIEIYSLELININTEKKQIEFRVKCSKGTYIRTLCENIAEKLKTVGYMKELKRTQVGEFELKDAITIEELENLVNKNEDNKNFITIENYFKNVPSITLDEKRIKLFLNGVKLTFNTDDGIYKIYYNKSFVGTGIVNSKLLKRDIII